MKIKVYVQFESKRIRRQKEKVVIFIQCEIFCEGTYETRVALVKRTRNIYLMCAI